MKLVTKSLSRTQKLLLSGVAVTTAAALAGFGTYANWTQSQTATQNVTTGTFGLALGGTAPLVNNLPIVSVDHVVPGDSMPRVVDVSNTGNTPFKTLTLAPTGTGGTVPGLNDGSADALTWTVYSCASEWTSNNAATGCAGGAGTVLKATEALTGSNSLDLSTSTAATTAPGTDHLLVVTAYPTGATLFGTYGGLSDAITYTFSATQRDGVVK